MLHRLALRVASAPTVLKGGDRLPYMQTIFDQVQKTYAAIGVPIQSPSDLLKYDVWHVYFGSDDVVAFTLYQSTPFGLKSGLSGSDGSVAGKAQSKQMLDARAKSNSWYGEVSHTVEKLLIRAGVPVVCAHHVPDILGKDVEPDVDGLHYRRAISGVGVVRKIMVGQPRGVPVTDYNNPVCGLYASSVFESESGMDDFDFAAHLGCLL